MSDRTLKSFMASHYKVFCSKLDWDELMKVIGAFLPKREQR